MITIIIIVIIVSNVVVVVVVAGAAAAALVVVVVAAAQPPPPPPLLLLVVVGAVTSSSFSSPSLSFGHDHSAARTPPPSRGLQAVAILTVTQQASPPGPAAHKRGNPDHGLQLARPDFPSRDLAEGHS